MPKSPTKRRPITRAALTDSALELFLEKGFHATSISDIVERAGLTRGAFYSNYRDKEELFLALYDAHTDRLLTELREAFAHRAEAGTHPLARLHERITGRTPEERRWFMASMEFTLHAARHPEIARALAGHENRLTRGLAEVVSGALARDGYRSAVDPEDLARLLVAAFEGLTAREVIHGADEPARLLPQLLDALSEPA
ncbi:TetR/AcrR family transcriptional regulator [Streptomyces sp. RM1]|uniref:TetR/AcrR family transcriptional regulator n=1 Tax=Streptomyces misionensis TaxID=67331 RepID=UPI00396B741D